MTDSSDHDQAQVTLTMTLAQARSLSQALDVFTRLGIGQVAILDELAREDCLGNRHEDKDNFLIYDEIEQATQLMASALGHAKNSSLGISHERVNEHALSSYEINKVLRKAMANHQNPTPRFRGVDYDGLVLRYTQHPAPTATITTDCDKNGCSENSV